MTWKVVLPLKITVSGKPFYLNLNQYRNAHYHTLNKAKVSFAELVTPLLTGIPFMDSCHFKYVYYSASHRESDISNICSVVDKFFSDTFVAAGKLIDDNYNYLKKVTYVFGGIDPTNPRVEVFITSKEQQSMKLIITQADLQQAVASHLSNLGFQINADLIQIDQDEIEIDLNPTSETVEKPKQVRRKTATKTPTKTETEVQPSVPEVFEEPEVVEPLDEVAEEDKDVVIEALDEVQAAEPKLASSIWD